MTPTDTKNEKVSVSTGKSKICHQDHNQHSTLEDKQTPSQYIGIMVYLCILISLIFSHSYYVWFYTRFAKPPGMVQSGGSSPVQRPTGTQTRVNQTICLVLYSFIFKTFFVKLNTYIHQYTSPNPNQRTTNTWNCELWFYILEIF